jgi:serine/threonine protein kinase
VKVLGRGAHGRVYQVTEKATSRPGALKLLIPRDDSSTEMLRFEQEAEVAAGLDAPTLAGLLDHGFLEDGQAYLVYEFIEGGSLEGRLSAGPAYTVDGARRVAADIARALSRMHAAGLVHRDVKPGNILLREDGGAVLGDFGLARFRRSRIQTTTGTVLGTPHYLPAEAWLGREVGPAADQFALAVCVHEMLWGRPAYSASLVADILRWIEGGRELRVAREPGVPEEVRAAVERGLRRDPRERFPDVEAFARALAPPRRGRYLAGAALAVAVGVGALIASSSSTPTPPAALVIAPPASAVPVAPAVPQAPSPAPYAESLTRLLRFHPDSTRPPHTPEDMSRDLRPLFASDRVELAYGRLLTELVEEAPSVRDPRSFREAVDRGLHHVFEDFRRFRRAVPDLLSDVRYRVSPELVARARRTSTGMAERIDQGLGQLEEVPGEPWVLYLRARLATAVAIADHGPKPAAGRVLADLHWALDGDDAGEHRELLEHLRWQMLEGPVLPGSIPCSLRVEAARAGYRHLVATSTSPAKLAVHLARVGFLQVGYCPEKADPLLEIVEGVVEELEQRAPRPALRATDRTYLTPTHAEALRTSPRARQVWGRFVATVDWLGEGSG